MSLQYMEEKQGHLQAWEHHPNKHYFKWTTNLAKDTGKPYVKVEILFFFLNMHFVEAPISFSRIEASFSRIEASFPFRRLQEKYLAFSTSTSSTWKSLYTSLGQVMSYKHSSALKLYR